MAEKKQKKKTKPTTLGIPYICAPRHVGKHWHWIKLRGGGGGGNVDMVLLSCVHLLPSHFAKDHSINKRIC